jgi:outer membrane protein assembly factor BamD
MFGQMRDLIRKGPDVSRAPKVGNPTLVDTEVVAPSTVVQKEFADSSSGEKALGVTVINPNQPASDSVPPIANPLAPPGSPLSNPSNAGPPAPDPNELKPTAPADPNELKPADSGTDTSLPPPTQVNEIQGQSSSVATKADDTPASDQEISSSKKKKKKGLSKINPF